MKSYKLKKAMLRWRRITRRRGHGVHSPFVYTLITKVIEEQCGYYCYDDIELVRKQLAQKSEKVTYSDRKTGAIRERSVGEIVQREAISPKQGKLLFRLANHLKPKTILQFGASMSISTLYLCAYSKDIQCVLLEKDTGLNEYLLWALKKNRGKEIILLTGDYEDQLTSALATLKTVDFVFFDLPYEQITTARLLRKCIETVNKQTVFVFNEIREKKWMRQYWKEIKELPEVTVSLDLGTMGIVFFNPKLHKQNYKVWF